MKYIKLLLIALAITQLAPLGCNQHTSEKISEINEENHLVVEITNEVETKTMEENPMEVEPTGEVEPPNKVEPTDEL